MNRASYTAAVFAGEPDEGGFWAEVLELSGCVAQGETLDELRANLSDAISAWEDTKQEIDGDTPEQDVVAMWTLPSDRRADGGLVATGR